MLSIFFCLGLNVLTKPLFIQYSEVLYQYKPLDPKELTTAEYIKALFWNLHEGIIYIDYIILSNMAIILSYSCQNHYWWCPGDFIAMASAGMILTKLYNTSHHKKISQAVGICQGPASCSAAACGCVCGCGCCGCCGGWGGVCWNATLYEPVCGSWLSWKLLVESPKGFSTMFPSSFNLPTERKEHDDMSCTYQNFDNNLSNRQVLSNKSPAHEQGAPRNFIIKTTVGVICPITRVVFVLVVPEWKLPIRDEWKSFWYNFDHNGLVTVI